MISADLWTEYTRTVVEVFVPDGTRFRLYPTAVGDVGQWPSAVLAPVHFLTGWDPGDERPGASENRRQQAALEGDLTTRGLTIWPTVGRNGESHHSEEGVAVMGMREEDALALALHYRQNAIFSWTPTAWSTVSCVDDTRHDAGWRMEPLGT
jgi:hypothetical protein